MGFVLDYQVFFRVSVVDEGSGKSLPGVSFSPTSRCARLLSDHQLVFRPREAGFAVYSAANPQAADPLLGRITSLITFSFTAQLKDSSFFTRYAPDPAAMPGPHFYLDNLQASGVIQPAGGQSLAAGAFVDVADAARIYPQVFFAKTDLSAGPVPSKYLVKKFFNPAVTVKEVTIDSGGATLASTRIDLSAQSGGPYLLDTDSLGSSPQTIYLDNELSSQGVLGVVDISWESPQDGVPAGGLNYLLRFKKQ